MEIYVRELTNREDLRRAMKTCLSDECCFEPMKPLSKKETRKALIQRHGSLNKYILHIHAKVPERVHTHLRTHHLLNEFYQSSTSRPDLVKNDGKFRIIDFFVPVKRLLEIYEVRLCDCSWVETVEFMSELKVLLEDQYSWFKDVLQPSCVYVGVCKELKSDTCNFWKESFVAERKKLMNMVKKIK